MPGAPAFCSTRLSASARFPRARNCSHGPLASAGPEVLGLHLWTLPAKPPKGLAAVNATITSTTVLTLGFAFSPSQPPTRSRLVIRRLLTSPRRTAPSRAPSSRTTPRTRRTGHLGHPWRSPQVRPATFIAHPPRLRNGPLMNIGLRRAEPTRPDRRASYAQPVAATATTCHVFLGSRLRLRLPSHPPHGVAVAIDLWLVPSTSTGDLHPQAAGHAGRTRVAGGVAAPGSLGSRRDSLPSPGSSHRPLSTCEPIASARTGRVLDRASEPTSV
jgi:hypothetical protein